MTEPERAFYAWYHENEKTVGDLSLSRTRPMQLTDFMGNEGVRTVTLNG
jgi:hypothetical protein